MELDQFTKELAVDSLMDVIELFFPGLACRLDFAKKDEEQKTYQKLIREIYPEVNEMITNPLIEQGRKQGIQQGKQSLLLQLLGTKFGNLPASVEKQIQAITSEEKLDQLSLRILTANSLDEMGLNENLNK